MSVIFAMNLIIIRLLHIQIFFTLCLGIFLLMLGVIISIGLILEIRVWSLIYLFLKKLR